MAPDTSKEEEDPENASLFQRPLRDPYFRILIFGIPAATMNTPNKIMGSWR